MAIRFEALTFAYPHKRHPALNQVSLEIPEASVHALLGPNGAGKTTLLRVLCGRLTGFKGTLQLPAELSKAPGILDPHKYGVLIENPGVYNRLTVREYLEFFGSFYAIPDLQARIKAFAERLQLKELNRPMAVLSLGQRQKVQIVRSLLHHPSLVLLDEPASNLDPISREEVWSLVREANQQQGTTFIICSHLLGELEQHSSHVSLIKAGRLLSSGTLGEIVLQGQGLARVTVRLLGTADPALLAACPGVTECKAEGALLHYRCASPEQANPLVITALLGAGCQVVEVHVEKPSLAKVYRSIMQEEPA